MSYSDTSHISAPPLPEVVYVSLTDDVETAATALTVSASSLNESVLPTSALSAAGANSARTITAIVPPSAVGNVNILVAVTDGSGGTSFATLQLAIVADSDFDGIPDSVEIAAGLDPNDPGDALLDKDSDGQSNLSEFVAGTDAADAASAFRIVQSTKVQGNWIVAFSSITGKKYRLEFCGDLRIENWQPAGLELTGTGEVSSFSIPDQSANRRFYRVVVESEF